MQADGRRIKIGILLLLPVAYVWNGWLSGRSLRSPLKEFGRSSLFVYWIHVEMVYGVVSTPLHRRLPLELAMLGTAALSLFMFALVRMKNKVLRFSGTPVLWFRFLGSRFLGAQVVHRFTRR